MDPYENLKETPYWLDPPPLNGSFAGKSLPEKTDVLIIGSGYTGMTAAIGLRQAGAHVALIDSMPLATAASARTGGQALTGLSEGVSVMKKTIGPEKLQRLFSESLEALNIVEHVVAEGKIDCFFTRCGHLEVAAKPSHFERLKKEQETLFNQFDHRTILIPPENMEAEIGSHRYHGALLDPLSGGVHPGKYIAGLARMANQCGVDLHERVEAKNIEVRNGRFLVKTDTGVVSAEQVVVATNGYSGNLVPWLYRRVIPVESMIIATEELPPEIAKPLIPNGRMIFDTKNLLFYFRLSPDGKRLLFGGRLKSAKKSMRENAIFMRRNLLQVYPQLEQVGIEYAWSGNVAITWDRLPHIGRQNGIYYAMGYCGHGVALASYLGRKLSEMILGSGTPTVFADNTFTAIPFFRTMPWALPIITLYYSTLDRFA
jgi:glycine/D-amino acid oxidase-like deaminating enzyme